MSWLSNHKPFLGVVVAQESRSSTNRKFGFSIPACSSLRAKVSSGELLNSLFNGLWMLDRKHLEKGKTFSGEWDMFRVLE